MEKLSDKEWLALRRYSTAPLSEVWRDAIDIVLLQRPASWNEEQIRKAICSAWRAWDDSSMWDGPDFMDHVYAKLKGQKPKTAEERVEIREESGDFPWVVYVDGHRISGHGIRNEHGHDEGAEGMRKRFVAALKESEASE